MSDIKVNGNTHIGIETLRFMKADNSGYAVYNEGAEATDTLMDTLITGGNIGDRVIEEATPVLNWMINVEGGTISFPYATSAYACVKYSKFDNLLLPNVTSLKTYAGPATKKNMLASTFEGVDVSGVFDLYSLATVMNNTATFKECKIGTLKLGSYLKESTQFLQNSTIENLVWNKTDLVPDNITGFLNAATKITNLYVPASLVSQCQAKVTDGTWTKVTNVYSIDDWED